MKEVEIVVYQTMIADVTPSTGLLALLGNSLTIPLEVNRILHAFEVTTPPAPGLTFGIYAAPKGTIPRFTRDVFVTFNIFANNYQDVAFRLMRLFDGRQHDLSVIPGGPTQIGTLSSVFDFEGPDGFDDTLNIQKKDLRFRFFATMKAQDPI